MRKLFAAVLVATAAMPAAAQQSNAARYLFGEQVRAACGTLEGATVDPQAYLEPDLTGDGRGDYIFAHEWVTCPDGAQSQFCGMICEINIYVREGDLLVLKDTYLGRGVELVDGGVRTCGAQGRCGTLRWTGSEFR